MTTIIACTFLGFAIGFGVGIGFAVLVYLLWGIRDTVGLALALSTIEQIADRGLRELIWSI